MRPYIKPDLYYENFALSRHVADCTWEVEADQLTCAEKVATVDEKWEVLGLPEGTQAFAASNASCISVGMTYEEYCYTNGAALMNLFKS